MNSILPNGIPLAPDYLELLGSKIFKDLERFANRFVDLNQQHLKSFNFRWGNDALHHWSRQWEYPYVHNIICDVVEQNANAKILDAGSGVTFFPYFLKEQFPAVSISCCDYDEKLARSFENINAATGRTIAFSVANLKALPYRDEEFHAIYCISVLEHTDNYEEIVDEFYRIMQPKGRLIVTFDVSLDGTRDLNLDSGAKLLRCLTKRFDVDSDISFDLHAQVSNPEIFTTLTANQIDANLLPWRFPPFLHRLKSLFRTGRLGSWPPPLTVFCLSLTKRPNVVAARE